MANLNKIRDLAQERGISLQHIAAQAGITAVGLSKIMRENSTKVATLEKIAETLGVSPCVFFDVPAPTLPRSEVHHVSGGSQVVTGGTVGASDKAIAQLTAELAAQRAQNMKLIDTLNELTKHL